MSASKNTDEKTTKPSRRYDNPSAAHAVKHSNHEGLTSATELAKVPAELDEPDVVVPTRGVCQVCDAPGKLDDDGNLLPHRAHGHGADDDDPICEGSGQKAAK